MYISQKQQYYWFLLLISAVLYALPFLFSDQLWWLIFIFPVPLLYGLCIFNPSFMHGYAWGCAVFILQLSGGLYLMVALAHELWPVAAVLGVGMVLYLALFPAFIFWFFARIIQFFTIESFVLRLSMWVIALWLFIVWADWYSMWLFGVQEGYPLMHPLILLAKKPALLLLMPIFGKQLLTGLFLGFAAGVVVLWWRIAGIVDLTRSIYFSALVLNLLKDIFERSRKPFNRFRASAIGIILLGLIAWLVYYYQNQEKIKLLPWYCRVQSLPYMACSTVKEPTVMIHVIKNLLKNIIMQNPSTELIIMPESAFNVSNFLELSDLLQCWNEQNIGKPIHFIFGASRWDDTQYYNSLHWVYNGVLQQCFDKKHAMLVSERLPTWMNNNVFYQMYFNKTLPISVSSVERAPFVLWANNAFVPYICSEFFCNELPDDKYADIPIIVIVNDSLFMSNIYSAYIQKLLVLLAQFKAIQWQRDIVYVSYVQSLFINKQGETYRM